MTDQHIQKLIEDYLRKNLKVVTRLSEGADLHGDYFHIHTLVLLKGEKDCPAISEHFSEKIYTVQH